MWNEVLIRFGGGVKFEKGGFSWFEVHAVEQ